MQGGRLRYYRPGIQLGRGLGGVLRGMGKIALAAARGNPLPVVTSMVGKAFQNYGMKKAKDAVRNPLQNFRKRKATGLGVQPLMGAKRKKKALKKRPKGIKRRKKKEE